MSDVAKGWHEKDLSGGADRDRTDDLSILIYNVTILLISCHSTSLWLSSTVSEF
jgi:hypothetical protein